MNLLRVAQNVIQNLNVDIYLSVLGRATLFERLFSALSINHYIMNLSDHMRSESDNFLLYNIINLKYKLY